MDKLLEDACLKLSVVASDIFGVSGRAMMAAFIAGERDPKALAKLARTRMRTKIGRLEEAFAGLRLGTFDDHHRFLLARMLARVDAVDLDIAAVDTQIGQHLAPFADAAARLDEIPARTSLGCLPPVISETLRCSGACTVDVAALDSLHPTAEGRPMTTGDKVLGAEAHWMMGR